MARRTINLVPTLFVGLGGTGQRVVGRIRQKIQHQFPNAKGLPVHFLAIDTDNLQRTQFAFRPDEYVEISNFDGAAVLNRLDRYPMVKAWWPENLGPADVGNVDFGAGQTRPVGRLAFYYWYPQRLKEVVERKVKELTMIRSASELQALEDQGVSVEPNTVAVYLVASLCGGTGSGLVVDMAFELRNHLRLRKGVEVNAILTMPEGYMRAVPKGLQVERLQANTYAAMKEIDAFLDPERAKKVTLQYSSQTRAFSPDGPLFDHVSLLDVIDAEGNELENVEQLYGMIANKLTLELFVAGERRSMMRNVKIRREFVLGRRRHYDSFGAGALLFPAHDAVLYSRYLLAEEALGEMTKPADARAEVRNFLVRNELQEHQADMVLNKFRRLWQGTFTPIFRDEPLDVEKALPEAQKILEETQKAVLAVRKSVEKQAVAIREAALKALPAAVKGWLARADVPVPLVTHFLKILRAYVEQVLIREMEQEKKVLAVDVHRGRMQEALDQLRGAQNATWLPVLKARSIRTRFHRWSSNLRSWVQAVLETDARVSAQQIFVELSKAADEWQTKVKRVEDLLANAMWEARQRAERQLAEVRTEQRGAFKLIESVIDTEPEEGPDGSKGTKFDRIYKEHKPPVPRKIEALLAATRGLTDLVNAQALPAPEAFLDQTVLPLLADDFLKIYEIDVLDAAAKYNPAFDVGRALANILKQCQPFLSVDREALGEERRPERVVLVGVPDVDDAKYTDLLKEEKIGFKVSAVSTGDRTRAIVLVSDIGYPSHILTFLRDYRHYYRSFEERAKKREPEFMHLDKAWAGDAVPDLFPAGEA